MLLLPMSRRPSRRPTGWRLAARVLGELLVTSGCVVLLFVVYQLWWTNVEADRAASAVTSQLEQQWSVDDGSPTQRQEFPPALRNGQGFALLSIPRLGERWQAPVVQGVTLDDLAKGVGHYPDSALPGEVGNFAMAGHRATNGEPFAYLDRVRAGDLVVVETRTTYYTYRMDDWYLVPPTQVEVVAPVPNKPDATPRARYITLTTCNPRWASYERLIVHGVLVHSSPKSDGPPAALTEGG